MNISRQIRPPIYSLKQSKLRRRRVWRYAILYFILFVVFLALAIGPVVASTQLGSVLNSLSKPIAGMYLLQPTGLDNNDTMNSSVTGTGAVAAATTGGSPNGGASPSVTARIVKLF
jgi:1,3-beta-glucan synthase